MLGVVMLGGYAAEEVTQVLIDLIRVNTQDGVLVKGEIDQMQLYFIDFN